MIASLKICAAVHGTVDDNMAVRGNGDESGGDQEGERERVMISPLPSVSSSRDEFRGLLAGITASLARLARGILTVYLLLRTAFYRRCVLSIRGAQGNWHLPRDYEARGDRVSILTHV